MRLRVWVALAALMVAPMAFAGSYTLNDWCFYVNSLDINQSCNSGSGLANVPSANPGVTDLLHLQSDQTGSLTVTLAPGTYNVFAIFNYNLDGSGLNESATAVGQLSAGGQAYSVNNEGSAGTPGSLFAQGVGGSLDGVNHCASGCDDVAVALGYTGLNIPSGSSGTITFLASGSAPLNGGYIQQTDSVTNTSLNFSSSVQINATPEPGAMGLMGAGLGALLFFVRRRKA